MAERKNPIGEAAKRVKAGMDAVDKAAMDRMPKDFQEMHKRRKERKK